MENETPIPSFDLSRINPLTLEWEFAKAFDEHNEAKRKKWLRKRTWQYRYPVVISKLHNAGLVAKLGNVRREVAVGEYCMALKALKDEAEKEALDKEDFRYFLTTINFIYQHRGRPICISWDYWRDLRALAKKYSTT